MKKRNKAGDAPIPVKVNNFHANNPVRAKGGLGAVYNTPKGNVNNYIDCVSTVVIPINKVETKHLEPVIVDIAVNGKIANELVGQKIETPELIAPTDFMPTEKLKKQKKHGTK
jgi:hypothetical protein